MFWITVLKPMIWEQVSGFDMDGFLLFPRVAILVSDQPEHRAFRSQKGLDSYMGYFLSTLASQIPTAGTPSLQPSHSIISWDYKDIAKNVNTASWRTSDSNRVAQRDSTSRAHKDVTYTVKHQLNIYYSSECIWYTTGFICLRGARLSPF